MNIIEIHVSKIEIKNQPKFFLEKYLALIAKTQFLSKVITTLINNQIRELFPKSNHIQVKCLNKKKKAKVVMFFFMKQRNRSMQGFKNFSQEKINRI